MPKVLIVANGEWPKQFDVETVGTYRVVIALDGAANRLIGSNMIPDVLLGDLDSVSESVLEQCMKKEAFTSSSPGIWINLGSEIDCFNFCLLPD